MLKPPSTYASDGFPTTDIVSKTVSRNATSVHIKIDKWFKMNFSTVIFIFSLVLWRVAVKKMNRLYHFEVKYSEIAL